MKKTIVVLMMVAAVGVAQAGVVGKDGQTLPDREFTPSATQSSVRAAWEWSTAGTMDAAATTGGSTDGWGTHFMATTVNNTGQDMQLVEFGWPCAGTIGGQWLVWLGTSMPANNSNPDYSGVFGAADPDDSQNPPPTYTYVDVFDEGIVVPAGETIWFAYLNPGIGGQIDFNGVDTWAWYGDLWDPDQGWGRTAVMQLKGDPAVQPTPTVEPTATPGEAIPTLSDRSLLMLVLALAGLGILILMRRR